MTKEEYIAKYKEQMFREGISNLTSMFIVDKEKYSKFEDLLVVDKDNLEAVLEEARCDIEEHSLKHRTTNVIITNCAVCSELLMNDRIELVPDANKYIANTGLYIEGKYKGIIVYLDPFMSGEDTRLCIGSISEDDLEFDLEPRIDNFLTYKINLN